VTALKTLVAESHQNGITADILTRRGEASFQKELQCTVPATIHQGPAPSYSFSYYHKDLLSRYDLVHIHGLWNLLSSVMMRTARRLKIPYLVRPCGMLSAYSWQRSRVKKTLYWWLIDRSLLHHASSFHVTSHDEERETRQVCPDIPAVLTHLPIDSEFLQRPAEPTWLREQLRVPPAYPIVLFLSRFHPKKGILTRLLPAWRSITNAHLAIVGMDDPATPHHRDEIRCALVRDQLTDRVSILGPAVGLERARYFDGADLFVLPSESENFGQVVTEAMARGCPVLVSDGVQSHPLVTAAGAGEVVSGEAAQWAKVLARWIADPQRRYEAGCAGPRYVEQNLHSSQVYRTLFDRYRIIVSHYQ
jgi:glycosyltransferase involved in cell wall biosynthesis